MATIKPAPKSQTSATLPPLASGGHPLFGHLPVLQRDPLNFYLQMHAQYGDIVRMRSGPWFWVAVRHPNQIKYILQDNNHNYRKGLFYDTLRLLLGNGLLTSDGDFWLRQRRLAQPAFHRQRIDSFATIMSDSTAAMLDRWQHHPPNTALDIHHEMMRLTLQIVGLALFSTDVSAAADEVGDALNFALGFVNTRGIQLLNLPLSVPTPNHRRYRQAEAKLNHLIQQVIDERRQDPRDRGDLLSMFLIARDEDTQARMTDQQLRDELMTIFLAGHETTANLLTWAFYLLSTHPTVRERLIAEVDQVLAGQPPTLADLPNLPYTRMVIDETLRMYPPAWLISRTTNQPDEIDGYHIPADIPISISAYITQRDPRFWPNPEGFDPQRFDPKLEHNRPQFAYLPFGGGPRLCIGNNFAIIEAQIVLAMITQHFVLNCWPGVAAIPEPTVTLRPKHGMPMLALPRAFAPNHPK